MVNFREFIEVSNVKLAFLLSGALTTLTPSLFTISLAFFHEVNKAWASNAISLLIIVHVSNLIANYYVTISQDEEENDEIIKDNLLRLLVLYLVLLAFVACRFSSYLAIFIVYSVAFTAGFINRLLYFTFHEELEPFPTRFQEYYAIGLNFGPFFNIILLAFIGSIIPDANMAYIIYFAALTSGLLVMQYVYKKFKKTEGHKSYSLERKQINRENRPAAPETRSMFNDTESFATHLSAIGNEWVKETNETITFVNEVKVLIVYFALIFIVNLQTFLIFPLSVLTHHGIFGFNPLYTYVLLLMMCYFTEGWGRHLPVLKERWSKEALIFACLLRFWHVYQWIRGFQSDLQLVSTLMVLMFANTYLSGAILSQTLGVVKGKQELQKVIAIFSSAGFAGSAFGLLISNHYTLIDK